MRDVCSRARLGRTVGEGPERQEGWLEWLATGTRTAPLRVRTARAKQPAGQAFRLFQEQDHLSSGTGGVFRGHRHSHSSWQ